MQKKVWKQQKKTKEQETGLITLTKKGQTTTSMRQVKSAVQLHPVQLNLLLQKWKQRQNGKR